MTGLSFARIFSDGVILQRNKQIHVWGFGIPKGKVTVTLAQSSQQCTVNDAGRFDAYLPAMDKGGPYTLEASHSDGGSISCSDVWIGDVIMVCGQSNMEFPMERVHETYPDEWKKTDKKLRTFKVIENAVFGRTIKDVVTGQWKSLDPETIDPFSAVGYFTAKHLRLAEDVAVGIVDITMGGAPIEAFMSTQMLEGFDEALAEAAKFADDAYKAKILESNEKNAAKWLEDLDKGDAGINQHYEDGRQILKEGRSIVLPDFFSDTELDGFIGSLWIAKEFTVPSEYVGKAASLWFGTIVDFDSCYVNGEFIGNTEYTYPPRRYAIREGLIHEGVNTVVLRIGVEKGYGRITPGKIYGIVFGSGRRISDGFNERLEGVDHIEYLGGKWKYLVGNRCEASKDQVFVSWKPTALHYGMLEPLAGFAMKAFAFYQGESNCQRNFEYKALTGKFISGLRTLWNDDIPYICVQLPEFNARMEEISYDGGKAWRGLMEAQENCRDIPGFYLVRSYGTGELNDLHPQRKEPIGKMIADVIVSSLKG